MNIRRTIRLPLAALLLSSLLAITGCATNAAGDARRYDLPPMREDTIARLAVDGPNAYINALRVPHGSYVRDGDVVTTGPGTSVQLLFNQGGSVQLDQNTDPLFRLIRQSACVLMEIAVGQAAVATNNTCIEFRNQRLNTAGVARSLINVDVRGNEARITVIEGRVEMANPGSAVLYANDQYVATSPSAWYVQKLAPEAARARGAWTQRYFAVPAARLPDATIPLLLLGGIGAVIFGRDAPATASPPEPVGVSSQNRAAGSTRTQPDQQP